MQEVLNSGCKSYWIIVTLQSHQKLKKENFKSVNYFQWLATKECVLVITQFFVKKSENNRKEIGFEKFLESIGN